MIRKHSTRLSQVHDEDPEDDREQHRTAAHDYPEMGSVLTDRPDPGGVITVIGTRKTAAAYGTEEDPRNQEYNGGSQDTGMNWAEPAEQEWTEEHLGPQQEAPPPPWEMMPPAMARLAQIEEACQFFAGAPWRATGTRHRATDINGTHVDDAGDAPAHGTIPRATDPDSYDARSTEGQGDDRWNQALPQGNKAEENAATVGMYPEGMSAGGGPGLEIGAFTASAEWEQHPDLEANVHGCMVTRQELIRHMEEAHGHQGAGHFPSSSLRFMHATAHGEGEEHLPGWEEGGDEPGPSRYDEPAQAPHERDPDWNGNGFATYHPHGGPIDPVFGARTAALSDGEFRELRRHMTEGHGLDRNDPDLTDPVSLSEAHSGHHEVGTATHAHGEDYEFSPYWDEDKGAGSYHEFTGSRVPWTGKERGSLHRWQESPPSSTWGDFVPSAEFPLLGPGEHVHHADEGEGDGIGPVEAVSGGPWEEHLRRDHGWGDHQFGYAQGRGDHPRDIHEALHAGGLADHQHPEHDPEQSRQQSLVNMFGPDITDLGPHMTKPSGYPLALDEHGGSAGGDPLSGITRSRELRPRPPENVQQTDMARFRRMMSALNVHVHVHDHDEDDGDDAPAPAHEHDDPDDDLDSGPGDPGPSRTLPDNVGNDSSQVSGGEDPDNDPDNPVDSDLDNPVPGIPADPEDSPPADPGQWPAAGAGVSERNRAYTQGSGDGKVKRGAPPAGPAQEDDGDDPDGKPPFGKDAALAMFTAAAASPAFRFEFTAAWHDVVSKAKRIRAEGHVRITHSSAGMVIGEVRGDHDTYESGIQRPVGKRQVIQHWACGCPWASFKQDKSSGARYAGRPCSHVMALQFEAQSRGMFGRSFEPDAEVPSWSPSTVVVKSYPPYDGDPHRGRWNEEWRAPLARRRSMARTAEMFCPSCGGDQDDSGRCMDCGQTSHDPRQHTATPDEARDWDWSPEERDEWERATGAPWQECLYRHAGPCPAAQDGRTAGAVNHPRPAEFRSQVSRNPDFDPHARGDNFEWSTHVMHGYIGSQHVGSLHYSVSDDGKAFGVERLHSTRPGEGVASSLMDDLYGQVKQAGGWLNHGQRTRDGNAWWNSYREPHPEVNVHRAHPEQGWGHYFSPGEAADDAERNKGYSAIRLPGGSGYHPDQDWHEHARAYPDQDWHGQWKHATGMDAPERSATAALLRAGEDPDEVGALRLLAGLHATADQANAPWGSDNTSQRPPQKPYGATSPPNLDQDPGSYGPLAGPDPANWGGIDDGSALQMPLSNTAAHQVLVPGAPHPVPGDLHWPGVEGWQPEDQGTFSYTDHAGTAGPSTAMNARDPNGIRMEESRAELHDDPEPALPSTTGDDLEATAAADGTIGGGDAGTGEGQEAPLDTAALGEFGASVREHFRQTLGGTPMGDLSRETSPQAQQPSPVGQEPGMGSGDDYLSPEDPSIQTVGNQQWSGGGADSDETAVPAGDPQGGIEDVVASFQRSAAAGSYSGGSAPGHGDGDIAVAARQYLSKTADVLPQAEADELVREGRGQRARNLDLLRLEGTHYEEEDEELGRKGVSLNDYDDDVIFA
jgi:hypothetical protein